MIISLVRYCMTASQHIPVIRYHAETEMHFGGTSNIFFYNTVSQNDIKKLTCKPYLSQDTYTMFILNIHRGKFCKWLIQMDFRGCAEVLQIKGKRPVCRLSVIMQYFNLSAVSRIFRVHTRKETYACAHRHEDCHSGNKSWLLEALMERESKTLKTGIVWTFHHNTDRRFVLYKEVHKWGRKMCWKRVPVNGYFLNPQWIITHTNQLRSVLLRPDVIHTL